MIKLFEKIRHYFSRESCYTEMEKCGYATMGCCAVELVGHGQQIIYQKLVLIVNIQSSIQNHQMEAKRMTTELKVMVGVPGSGKSTWVKQEVARIEEEHRTTCVVSRDFVRQSILTDRDGYFDKEVEVFNEFIRQINEAMELGIDVVFVDATHISPASRAKLLGRLIVDPHTKLTFEVIDVPIETALERNAQRTGIARIPDSAIKKMKKGFSIPTEKEFPKTNWGFSNIEVCVHH